MLAAAIAFSMRWKGAEAGDGNFSEAERPGYGNTFARLSSTELDAAHGAAGTLRLSGADDCLGLVTFCGEDGEVKLEWHCNTGTPYAVELGEDRFYVLLETETGGQLRCLSLADGEELWRCESAQGFCDLGLLEDGTLCVIGLESALVLDAQGVTVYEYEYGSQPLGWGFEDGSAVIISENGRVELYAEGERVYNEE